MPDVVMPRLSDSMEEGTILKWLKADGDEVPRGEELVEIETDKATMTYEADAAGVLRDRRRGGRHAAHRPAVSRGSASGGERRPSAPAEARRAAAASRPRRRDRSEPPAPPGAARAARRRPRRDGAAPRSRPRARSPPRATAGGAKASPLARRIARERGVDLAALRGSGPGGRIVKADVEARRAGAAAAPAAPPAAPRRRPRGARRSRAPALASRRRRGTAKGDVQIQELDAHPAAHRPPDGRVEGDRPRVHAPDGRSTWRAASRCAPQLKELAADERPAPSYNDMVVKACALALREYPRANGAYRDGRFELYCARQRRRGRRRAGRARRPDGLRRRPQDAGRDRRARPARWPSACAPARSRRRSSAAARSPSRTSACTA